MFDTHETEKLYTITKHVLNNINTVVDYRAFTVIIDSVPEELFRRKVVGASDGRERVHFKPKLKQLEVALLHTTRY